MKIQRVSKIPGNEDLKKYLQQRSIPVKFCYPKEGGDKWHKLRSNNKYDLGVRELTAFKGSLPDIKKAIGEQPVNLVHLGPGDGIEIPILFETFMQKSNEIYAGVDISEQMIYNTVSLNSSYFSNVNQLWYIADIETESNLELICKDVKKNGSGRNLILLTNQGVLLSNSKTLENIYDSMQDQDYLFITIEGNDKYKRGEICSTYDLPEVRNLLSVGLQRAGYKPDKGRFRTIFDKEKSRVEVYFKPEDEPEISCLTSYKPKEDDFIRLLEGYGFEIQFMRFYERVHTFAVLCKKEK
ncbi:MAG: L-histidine N(alpha)-methyltransferase [Nanoarchaeota archaeon]|nr:L-histidine N(alpha)-methyltransferase [Nanoarchaeota archaeon]